MEQVVTSDATAAAAAAANGYTIRLPSGPDSRGTVLFHIDQGEHADAEYGTFAADLKSRKLTVNPWEFMARRHEVIDAVMALKETEKGAIDSER